MPVSIDDYREIQLQAHSVHKHEGPDAAIDYVRSILDRALDADLRNLLLQDLAMYYTTAGKLEQAETTLRQAIDENPDDPLPWCALASHYRVTKLNLDLAANIVDTALEIAKAQNRLIRHVLAERIDIALDREDYPTVEGSLVQMLEAPRGPEIRDVRLEDYFLNRISVGKVSTDLLKRYRAAVSTARMPPGKA